MGLLSIENVRAAKDALQRTEGNPQKRAEYAKTLSDKRLYPECTQLSKLSSKKTHSPIKKRVDLGRRQRGRSDGG